MPLASTTYYFESLDELLEGALRLSVDEEGALTEWAERIEGQDLPPLEMVRLFRSELDPDAAQFELYVEAARRPRLREVARQQHRAVRDDAGRATRRRGERPSDQPAGVRGPLDGPASTASPAVTIRGSRRPVMALWAAATRAIGTR